jgi:DNA-binding transcriptional ArsR family regulator
VSDGKQTKRQRRARSGAASTRRPAERVALRQMRALAHPLRMRLIELFAERSMTTKQAALALGEPPTKLYHHVAALERAGIVRLRETRPNRGTVEKYFEISAHHVMGRPSAVRGSPDMNVAGALVFDRARDELIRTLAARRPGSRMEVVAIRGVLHLSAAQRRELARELVRLVKRAAARARAGRGASKRRGGASASEREHGRASDKGLRTRRYSLTVALIPADGEREH